MTIGTINTSSIWRWLLDGDVGQILVVTRMLVLSGNYARANRLLSEARVWGLI